MPRNSESQQAAALWTWSAVLAGALASLTSQALLTMLALGVGLLSIDGEAASSTPGTLSTAALLWWIASGVFSAFLGGAVAGAYSPVAAPAARSVNALAAWAVATLVILGSASLSGASTVVAHMSSPGSSAMRNVTAQSAITGEQADRARRLAATVMLASFVGLLAGAVAAGAGGWYGRDIARSLDIPADKSA